MTSTRQRQPQLPHLEAAASPAGEQLRLALPVRPVPVPAAQDLPAQLRLDARTRQIGRAGIAEIRRILAGMDDTAARAA